MMLIVDKAENGFLLQKAPFVLMCCLGSIVEVLYSSFASLVDVIWA